MSETDSTAQAEMPSLATRGKRRANAVTATRGRRGQQPRKRNNGKPPHLGANIEWVQKGVGWDCREIYYLDGRRRRRVLGHLGRKRYENFCAGATPAELETRLFEWIEERKLEKQLPELGGAEQRLVM